MNDDQPVQKWTVKAFQKFALITEDYETYLDAVQRYHHLCVQPDIDAAYVYSPDGRLEMHYAEDYVHVGGEPEPMSYLRRSHPHYVAYKIGDDRRPQHPIVVPDALTEIYVRIALAGDPDESIPLGHNVFMRVEVANMLAELFTTLADIRLAIRAAKLAIADGETRLATDLLDDACNLIAQELESDDDE